MAEVERFWCVRGGQPSLDSDGFLSDPSSLILDRFSANPEAIQTSELRNNRAVVMLGEMGIGKSTVLRRPELLIPPALDVLAINLSPFGSEFRLSNEVVRHPRIAAWIAGSTELALVIDGFDEAQERIPQLGQILAAAIDEWPTERLILRIASRTSDWSQILERSIADSFGDSIVVGLLPLRRQDARAIAAELCDDPDAFLAAVDGSESSAFASRPQTLRMLATAFQSSGMLPERAADIYDRGTQWLAQEANEGRVESKLTGSLTVDERIAVGRRVAAGLTFGRAAAVRTDRPVDVGSEDLPISTISQGVEPTAGHSVSVSESAIKEILSSGLFVTVGSGRLAFAHSSFGDYLTAAWMHANRLSVDKARSLLIGPDSRIRPQLRGVAAWLVAIAPDRFGWLTAQDPESFLGQVSLPSAKLRMDVIEGLFSIADRRDWGWGDRLEGLKHPEIVEQLRLQLVQGTDDQRRLAIKLARDCRVVDVRPELTAMALDAGLDDGLRSRAGHAVISFAPVAQSADLAPLALDGSIRGGDDMDELFAIGLLASWPHAIDTNQVFSLLHPPKSQFFFGSYRRFIDDFAHRLRPEDVVQAISWLDTNIDEIESGDFEELANAIIRLAGAFDIDANIQQSLRRIAVTRAEDYQGILFSRNVNRSNSTISAEARRRLANALIDQATNDRVTLYISDRPARGSGLITPDDLDWIVAEAATATGHRLGALDKLFGWSFVEGRRDHLDLILDLSEEHPIRAAHPSWFEVDLGSEVAAEMKRMYELLNPSQSNQFQPSEVEEGRVVELLVQIESGEPQAFVELGRVIAPNELAFDLTLTPTWRSFNGEMQERIAAAAHRYLETRSCDPDAWLDNPSILHVAAYAGYRALTLLLRARPAALEQLSRGDWIEWAPIIATMTPTVNGPSWEDKGELLRRADVHAHHELVGALKRHIAAAASTDMHLHWTNELTFLFDEDFEEFCVQLIETSAGPLTTGLLEVLCRERSTSAVPMLRSMLTRKEPEQHANRIAAGVLLVDHDLEESWPLLKSEFDADHEMALEVLGTSDTVRFREGDTLLPEATLADMYLWLRRSFDPSDDPQYAGVHAVQPREEVGRWRDQLLIELRDRGTAAAVNALATAAQALPTDMRLRRTQAAAMSVFSRKAWEGHSIRELVQLAQHDATALVSTERDLQAVVANALTVVQMELTGSNPQSHLLWDTHSRRPKSEDEISDHLRNRLSELTGGNKLVVNREVQVRRNRASGVPERTDLQVDAATGAAGPFPTISLPVEVKGAWNDELMTAMRSQLAERYMTDLHTAYGCYVVLWPDVEPWTDKDSRRRDVARLDRDDVANQLALQAQQLRDEGYYIEVVHLGIEYKRPDRSLRQRLMSAPLSLFTQRRKGTPGG